MGDQAFKDGTVEALLFDVFGTTVDWRRTTTTRLIHDWQNALQQQHRQMPDEVRQKASSMTEGDWGTFAQAWRTSYYTFVHAIAKDPSIPYKTIDEHHYDALKELLQQWQLEGLWSEQEIKDLSLVWHSLEPWPDTVQGIRALNKRFATCTLSNGNVSLLTDMARHAGLEWTHIFSAEMFGTYKPNPGVYLGAAKKLGLEPGQCAMVAAHLNDLKAAKDCGFKVLYVERKREEAWGAEKVAATKSEGWVDIWVDGAEDGFLAAAEKAGII